LFDVMKAVGSGCNTNDIVRRKVVAEEAAADVSTGLQSAEGSNTGDGSIPQKKTQEELEGHEGNGDGDYHEVEADHEPEEYDDGDDDDDDEWDDDADPGYVTFPITEAEFYSLEEAAMREAHVEVGRAALAAKFGLEYEDGADDKDIEMREAEALLKHAPLPKGPQSPRVEVPLGVDLAGSLVAEADAPLWPKDAQAYAFSQAGDDEEYQSYVQGVEAASSDRETSISMGLSDVPVIKPSGRAHSKSSSDKQGLAGAAFAVTSGDNTSARIHEIATGRFGHHGESYSCSGGVDSATSDVSDPDADTDDDDLAVVLNQSPQQAAAEELECFYLKV